MHYSEIAWVALSVVVFVTSWSYTSGGYPCSIPLSLLLLVYQASHLIYEVRDSPQSELLAGVKSLCKRWATDLIQRDTRSLVLLASYWSFLVVVTLWFPHLEQSNGSPYSLIFFTVAFIFIFIAPTLVGLLVLLLAMLLKWEQGLAYSERSRANILAVILIIWEQRVIIAVLSGIVVLMFALDGDSLSVIRYIMNGRPCWPLLIPHFKYVHAQLPYPLQHAWIKSWHKIFSGYSPSIMVVFIQNFGRELGEVSRLLPVLVGVYVVSLLLAPSNHSTLRLTLFACVAGVVLGGVTSGSFKILLHRYRPNAYGDPYKWKGPGTAVVNHLSFSKLDLSFPAGHTTVTCAVATCLYVAVLQRVRVSSVVGKALMAFIIYMFPVAVLVSRVGDCYHWTSDAAFGVCSLSFKYQNYDNYSYIVSLNFSRCCLGT